MLGKVWSGIWASVGIRVRDNSIQIYLFVPSMQVFLVCNGRGFFLMISELIFGLSIMISCEELIGGAGFFVRGVKF